MPERTSPAAEQAHDVLAAEEFAMPAPSHRSAGASGAEPSGRPRRARDVAVGALALALLIGLGRKGHS